MIDDLIICVVIKRDEHGFQWEVRWRLNSERTLSKWTYVVEQTAINEALDAVLVLA